MSAWMQKWHVETNMSSDINGCCVNWADSGCLLIPWSLALSSVDCVDYIKFISQNMYKVVVWCSSMYGYNPHCW